MITKYSPEFKIEIIVQHLNNGVDKDVLCNKYGIKRGTFASWKHEFLQAGSERLKGRCSHEIEARKLQRALEKRDELLRLARLQINFQSMAMRHNIKIKKNKRYMPVEKLHIIHAVINSGVPIPKASKIIGIHNTTFYQWYEAYSKCGVKGLLNRKAQQTLFWNQLPPETRATIIDVHHKYPYLGASQLKWHLTDCHDLYVGMNYVQSVLRSLIPEPVPKSLGAPKYLPAQKNPYPSTHVHERWQTDYTQIKLVSKEIVFLAVVIDDYSRYILSHGLYASSNLDNVIDLITRALAEKNKYKKSIAQRSTKILTDRASYYIARRLNLFYGENNLIRIIGPINRPTSRGKVERFFKTVKHDLRSESFESLAAISSLMNSYIDYYNNVRGHHSLDHLTPADVYFEREEDVLKKRKILRREFLEKKKSVLLD